MKVKLTKVRLTFPNLFKPDQKYNRFGASFPIEPGSDNAKALNAAIAKVAEEKWGEKAKAILTKMKQDGALCYLEREKTNSEGAVYDGYQGMHTLNATQASPAPTVVDRDRTPLTSSSGKPYGGCYVNAIIDLWAQDNSFGKKINASLSGVQFESDGEAFGGGRAASVDDFEALEAADAEDFA